MKELVSVIILTYNKFNHLKETVDSVLKQKYGNIQVIVSDDGSKNFDYKYVENLFNDSPKNITSVRILSNENNLGTVKNFNNAIKKAEGSIIVPLSCDDEFMNCDTIARIQEYFSSNSSCLLCTGKRLIVNEDGKEGEIIPSKEDIKILKLPSRELFKKIALKNIISGACTYYKKEVFENYGYFDESLRLLEDLPFYLDYLVNEGKIGFLDLITLKYRMGGISTVAVMNPILKNDFKYTFKTKIFPRKNILGIKLYRKLKLTYYLNFFDNSNIIKLAFKLMYIDVIIRDRL